MTSIDIPGTAAPNNLHFGVDVRATIVDGDLYNICERIKEVDPRLFIVVLDKKTEDDYSFAIMEHCDDGWDRLVWRVKELDQRVLTKAERLRKIPFEHRMEEAEAMESRMKAEDELEAFNELYENLGAPMRREFEKTGFTNPKKSLSYPKASKK